MQLTTEQVVQLVNVVVSVVDKKVKLPDAIASAAGILQAAQATPIELGQIVTAALPLLGMPL